MLPCLFSHAINTTTPASPDYVVSGAGTPTSDGDYYENGTYNSLPAYEKDGGGAWIFVSNDPPRVWAIYSEKCTACPVWYHKIDDGDTPPTGAWELEALGDEPPPTVT